MEMNRWTYVGDGSSVDASNDDRSVTSDAESKALVGQFAQVGLSRRVPLVLGRKQGQWTQFPEQILDGMLAKIGLSERQLQFGRSCTR